MNQKIKNASQLRELVVDCLVKLALPAVEQIKVIKNEDFLQELVLDFKDIIIEWSKLPENKDIDIEKVAVDIRIIHHFLNRFYENGNNHYWTFDALESHDDWNKVRLMTRQALQRINIDVNEQGMSHTIN